MGPYERRSGAMSVEQRGPAVCSFSGRQQGKDRWAIFLARGFPLSDVIPLTMLRNFLISSVCVILAAIGTSLWFKASRS